MAIGPEEFRDFASEVAAMKNEALMETFRRVSCDLGYCPGHEEEARYDVVHAELRKRLAACGFFAVAA